MTRLIDFGLGEIIDRLTILALKLAYQPGVIAFTAEREQLISRIRPRTADTPDTRHEWAQLARVNSALWQAHDRMRVYRKRFGQLSLKDRLDVADLAFARQALHDQRVELIRVLNESQS